MNAVSTTSIGLFRKIFFLGDPPDPARASEGVARGVCVALLPGLATLKSSDLSPLAIRVSTQPDNVSKSLLLFKNI